MSDLVYLTASDMAQAIRDRKLSAQQLLEAHLDQIAKHNPRIRAVVTIDADGARRQAAEADAALARGESWGPLHGVPMTVKDTWKTADMLTTSSYPPLAKNIPTRDATVVERLRAAGAIVFGKSNMPQLAFDSQSNSPLFGRANNPWNFDRTPGGSTGGGAAALAAGMTALEMGSDIGGSIRLPAHFCGVFGFKATPQVISSIGHIPGPNVAACRTHLSFGPLARSVDDLMLAFGVVAGPDEAECDMPPVKLVGTPVESMAKLRLAWSDELGGIPVSSEVKRVIHALAERLQGQGCVVEQVNSPDFDFTAALEAACELQASAFMFAHTTPLHLPRALFRRLPGLIYRSNPMARGFLSGAAADMHRYSSALLRRDRAINALERFLSGWDAWIVPVAGVPAFPHLPIRNSIDQLRATLSVDGQPVPYLLATAAYTTVFSMTGSPVVAMPAGQTADGLPVGIQLVGRRWTDLQLLEVAKAIAPVSGQFRRPPGF